MPDYPYHRSVRLRNFTVFRDATFEFVPGINVLVGGNGTGKTHLMKAMFAFQLAMERDSSSPWLLANAIAPTLAAVMPVTLVSELASFDCKAPDFPEVNGSYGTFDWSFKILGATVEHSTPAPQMSRPVFIPAVDAMAHTRRFMSTYDNYRIDFDLAFRDLVGLLLNPEARDVGLMEKNGIMATLRAKMGGEVEEEDERFYLRTTKARIPMPMVAEGLRKLATLYQLIRNGLLKPGATLYWDEPEVNLNPSLMDELVGCLLELTGNGVQIFLGTHSYIILKELEVQQPQKGVVRYFGLDTGDNGTTVNAAKSYLELKPNLIEKQYLSLYDRDIEKRLGGKR